jgi:phage terminase small subunit
MAGNDQAEQLTPKMEELIAALLSGLNITAAAKASGVAEKTARRWLKLPHFQKAYQAEQQSLFNERLAALRLGVSKCLATLARNMGEDAPPATQVRAAQIWLEAALDIHKMSELEAKIAELEQQLKQAGR